MHLKLLPASFNSCDSHTDYWHDSFLMDPEVLWRFNEPNLLLHCGNLGDLKCFVCLCHLPSVCDPPRTVRGSEDCCLNLWREICWQMLHQIATFQSLGRSFQIFAFIPRWCYVLEVDVGWLLNIYCSLDLLLFMASNAWAWNATQYCTCQSPSVLKHQLFQFSIFSS